MSPTDHEHEGNKPDKDSLHSQPPTVENAFSLRCRALCRTNRPHVHCSSYPYRTLPGGPTRAGEALDMKRSRSWGPAGVGGRDETWCLSLSSFLSLFFSSPAWFLFTSLGGIKGVAGFDLT